MICAEIYYRALLLNTPSVERTWDSASGSYPIGYFYFASVAGNAVLLRFGDYDRSLAGVSGDALTDHTIRSIAQAAAQNRWVNPGGSWGKAVYWDSTFETYLVTGAKLMWQDLDAVTRTHVDTIIRSAACNVVALGASTDTNGMHGGYQGTCKVEDMGMRTMPLATALAWLPDDPDAGTWREWLTRWMSNMGGLPAADQANTAMLNGRSVAEWNQAQNVWDTFIVENHGAYAPMYQQSMGAYPGRCAVQFLLSGRPVPEELRTPPNNDPLWFTMGQTGTDAGLPAHLLVADRNHLYGRDVLPVAARAMLCADPFAARAEAMLAARLLPYVAYPPSGQLTKFSGEPKYEPEARAEVAFAYLLHHLGDQLGGEPDAVSEQQYFARFATAVDYGPGPGLLAHQSSAGLAAAVTKGGYVKFAFLPGHDDWLFNVSGNSPSLLPQTSVTVLGRNARVYTRARDGFDGSATALTLPSGVAAFATLPDGSVVYATSGVDYGEGALRVHNLDMPGVPGLDGTRTFSWSAGSGTFTHDGKDQRRRIPGNWLNVDGRAGFVVRGGRNPIAVSGGGITLSDGPAAGSAGMVVEGCPDETPGRTERRAAEPAPASDHPGVVASLAGGQLSLFNLTGAPVPDAAVTIPQATGETVLYQGTQQAHGAAASRLRVTLPAADAQIAPARFTARSADGTGLPDGLACTVIDSRTVVLNGPSCTLLLRSLATGETVRVRVRAGQDVRADFADGYRTPTMNLARGRRTFPTSPLPAGMTDPAAAVDGDPGTSWSPGAAGRRIVVDLGAGHVIGDVRLRWCPGRAPAVCIEASPDGLHYHPLKDNGAQVRYIAVVVTDWRPDSARLSDIWIDPAGS